MNIVKVTCTQKWDHSVRGGECPGRCLCPTQRKMLSSESSYCPVGKEDYCFTSHRPPLSPRKQGTRVSAHRLPPLSPKLHGAHRSSLQDPGHLVMVVVKEGALLPTPVQQVALRRTWAQRGGHNWPHAHSWEASGRTEGDGNKKGQLRQLLDHSLGVREYAHAHLRRRRLGNLKETPRIKWDQESEVEKWAEEMMSQWAVLTV